MTAEEILAITEYLTSVKADPIRYIHPIYLTWIIKHPELKQLEPWANVTNADLVNNVDYKEALGKLADVEAAVLDHLHNPDDAYGIYYSYGEYLYGKGFIVQYIIWYLQIWMNQLKGNKDIKHQVITALEKLAPYTSDVVQEAVGKHLQ